MSRRVVITGLGPLTSIGFGKKEFAESLRNGKSGISPIERFDTSDYDTKNAGEIKNFNPESFGIEQRDVRKLDVFSQYAIAGTKLALEDAGLKIGYEKRDARPEDILIRLGIGIGGMNTIEAQKTKLTEEGVKRVSPFMVPMIMPNAAAGNTSIYFNTLNEAVTVNSACASSINAIIDSYDKIKLERCRVAITGGIESCITPLAVAGFSQARALSKKGISRPYDANRDGFIMGEGAGIIILEDLEHALDRNARIYAEMMGYGSTSDAYHITAPEPGAKGLVEAIETAIKDSKIEKEKISYINSHGTSTELNDAVETLAFKKVFGKNAYRIPVSSTKSMIGHALGAAGGIEIIASVLSMENGFIHPTINYETPDPECDLDYVPNKAREASIDVILKTSLGFGGHNSAIILKKY